jgi:Terminase large subunit, T4likevirus-type, N-terminal
MKTLLPQGLVSDPSHSKLFGYGLNAKQSLVVDEMNWANDILFGGAKGGGKSFLIRLLWSVFSLAAPGIQLFLLRRTYDELWGNHMEGPNSFPVMLSQEVDTGECAIVNKEVRWRNGSRIFMRHMQLEKDKYKFQGKEMHGVAFDECTQFTETQIRYVLMSARLGAWEPPEGFFMRDRIPFWFFGANPGGVCHDFIKKRYVDLGPYEIKVGGVDAKDEGRTNRQFIPARAEDNPELLRNDPLYLERLEIGGDPAMVKAMRDGNWDVVAGAMFGDVWRERSLDAEGNVIDWHVCDPLPVPVGWEISRGGDDGFANPAAVYWTTKDPDTDTIYVVHEVYSAGLTAPELGERVKSADLMIKLFDPFDKTVRLNSEPLAGDYDSNAFVQTGRTNEISRGEQMNRMGCRWRPVQKWPGSRVARVQHLQKLLRPNPKERGRRPGIVFFRTCRNAIRTIPSLMRAEPPDNEDIKDGQEDHAFDGVTYAVQHRRPRSGMVPVGI